MKKHHTDEQITLALRHIYVQRDQLRRSFREAQPFPRILPKQEPKTEPPLSHVPSLIALTLGPFPISNPAAEGSNPSRHAT